MLNLEMLDNFCGSTFDIRYSAFKGNVG